MEEDSRSYLLCSPQEHINLQLTLKSQRTPTSPTRINWSNSVSSCLSVCLSPCLPVCLPVSVCLPALIPSPSSARFPTKTKSRCLRVIRQGFREYKRWWDGLWLTLRLGNPSTSKPLRAKIRTNDRWSKNITTSLLSVQNLGV